MEPRSYILYHVPKCSITPVHVREFRILLQLFNLNFTLVISSFVYFPYVSAFSVFTFSVTLLSPCEELCANSNRVFRACHHS